MAKFHSSRIRHKRTQVSGTTPTIGPSDNFTDGTWGVDDIYPGEFFTDMGGQVGWFGWSGSSSTGVEAWFAPDPTPVDILAGTGIEVNQISNFVYSIDSVGEDNYVNIEYTWLAGSTTLNIPAIIPSSISTPTNPSQLITEVYVLMIDTITYESYFGILGGIANFPGYPLRNMIFTYDGSDWSDPIGQGRYEDSGIYNQNDIPNVRHTAFSPDFVSTPTFKLITIPPPGTTIPNDIKVKFIVKYKYLNV